MKTEGIFSEKKVQNGIVLCYTEYTSLPEKEMWIEHEAS